MAPIKIHALGIEIRPSKSKGYAFRVICYDSLSGQDLDRKQEAIKFAMILFYANLEDWTAYCKEIA